VSPTHRMAVRVLERRCPTILSWGVAHVGRSPPPLGSITQRFTSRDAFDRQAIETSRDPIGPRSRMVTPVDQHMMACRASLDLARLAQTWLVKPVAWTTI